MPSILLTRRVAPLAALLCAMGRGAHAPGVIEVSEAIRSASPAPLVVLHDRVPRTDAVTDTAVKSPRFPVIGRSAPPLRVAHWLNVAKGNPLTFGDGHIYILDFTALWCGSCPATYPILHDLLAQYGPARVRPIFVTQVWGLAENHATLLRPAEELASFPAYFAKHHVTEPVAILDTVQSGMNAYSEDGNGEIALPKLILIDGRGIVREVMTGWDAGRARTQLFADVARLVSAISPATGETTSMVDTAPPVLTVDLLARLKTFLDGYRKESPIVHDSAKVHRASLHLQLPPEAAQAGMTIQSLGFPNNGTFPDIAVLAVRFPSVAADVHQAGLSARQIPVLAGAVWSAFLSDVCQIALRRAGMVGNLDTTTTVMRNVAFLRQHQSQVDALGLLPVSVAAVEDSAMRTSLDAGSDHADNVDNMVVQGDIAIRGGRDTLHILPAGTTADPPTPTPTSPRTTNVPRGTLVAEGRLLPRRDPTPFRDFPADDTMFVIPATIHGHALTWFVDYGADVSVMSSAFIDTLAIPHEAAGLETGAVGGAVLDTLHLGTSIQTNVPVMISPTDYEPIWKLWGNAGMLGRDLLSRYDVEFNVPAQRIRLYTQPVQSRPASPLHSPWLPPGLSVADCFPGRTHGEDADKLQFIVLMNGHPILSQFDSGINQTTMNWAAAKILGLTPTSLSVHLYPHTTREDHFVNGVTLRLGRRVLPEGPIVITDYKSTDATVPNLLLGIDQIRDRMFFLSFSTQMVCVGAPKTR